MHLNEAKSIVFEKLTSLVESTNANELITATQLAMKSLEPVVGIDGAKLYANLQSLLKLANKEDILNAFEQIKSNRFDNSEMTQYVDKIQLNYHLNIINGYCELLLM